MTKAPPGQPADRDPWDRPADQEAVLSLLPPDHPHFVSRAGPRPPEFAEGAEWIALITIPGCTRGVILRLECTWGWAEWEYETSGGGYEYRTPIGARVRTTTERSRGRPFPGPVISTQSWREALVAALVVPVSCSLAHDQSAVDKIVAAVTALVEASD